MASGASAAPARRESSSLLALGAEITSLCAELSERAQPGSDLTGGWCLAKSRQIDALVVRYMRLEARATSA